MLETGHGLAVPLKLCAFAHHSSDTVMSYAFTQQSRETPTGKLCSDLRLGSDGMKLQPAGSHHTRLSAGPPAVPSSSQPSYEIARIVTRAEGLVKPFGPLNSEFIIQNSQLKQSLHTRIVPRNTKKGHW